MRLLAAGLALLVAVPVLPAAPVPRDKKKTNAEKVLGFWKMTRSSTGSETRLDLELEFTPDGKLFLRQNYANGREFLREGTYKVEDDKIHYKVTTAGSEKEETLKLRVLTDDEMAFTDPDDIREEFVRVRKAGPDK